MREGDRERGGGERERGGGGGGGREMLKGEKEE